MPEHEDFADSSEVELLARQHDRREEWAAIVITAVALAVMLVVSLLVVVSDVTP